MNTEIKSCTFACLSLRPDLTSVAVNNTPHCGKPDSRTRIFIYSVQALKRGKQLIYIRHFETGPVIADEIYFFLIFLRGPKFN